MQLSKFTDYTFRALIYLAMHQEELCTVEQLAITLNVSEHHLKKVIHKLAKTDYVTSIKGRMGGLKLGVSPKEINLGKVLMITEDNLNIVECLNRDCVCEFMNSECELKNIVKSSLNKFIEEFANYTLEDILP